MDGKVSREVSDIFRGLWNSVLGLWSVCIHPGSGAEVDIPFISLRGCLRLETFTQAFVRSLVSIQNSPSDEILFPVS